MIVKHAPIGRTAASGLLAALLGLALSPVEAAAQTPYRSSFGTAPYVPLTGGMVHAPTSYALGYEDWDEGAVEIPLPFAFSWFERSYTSVWAYTNGFIAFQAPPPQSSLLRPPVRVPALGNRPHAFIAPMWTDLIGGSAKEIRSEIQGSAPDRTFTIQMTGLMDPDNPLSAGNFQIVLSEQGTVVIRYGSNNGLSVATTAYENADGTAGANLLEPGGACMSRCCEEGTCGSIAWPIGLQITIDRPPQAELIATVIGPRGAAPNTSFTARTLVGNVGRADAGAFDVQLKLSTDARIDSNDLTLGTITVAGLAAGTSTAPAFNATMPGNVGAAQLYLGVIVDPADTVTEADETNNTNADPGRIATAPDLGGTLEAPRNSGPGETIDVTLELRAEGLPVTAPIPVTIALSTDTTFDAMDRTLLTTQITLPDGFTNRRVLTVTIPADALPSPPNYRVLAVLDPAGAIPEVDEMNNTIASVGSLVLSVPDLEVTELVSAPNLFRGLANPITTTIRNNGGAAARAFTVCLVISRNGLISVVSDPIIVRTPTIALAGGATALLRLEPVIPVATGTGAWYLASVADCNEQLLEGLESNNVKRTGGTLTIRDAAPDLAPFEVRTASAAAVGEMLAVTVGIGNLGNAAGSAHVRLVLSANTGITTMDQTIYETTTPISLAAAAEQRLSVWAQIPGNIATGNYYVGAIIDPAEQLDEIDEDNNTMASRAISIAGPDLAIVTPTPPNAVTGVPYAWRFRANGGTGGYTWALTWASGTAPAGLMFDPALAEISGTPDAAALGPHDFTLRVTSGGAISERTYSILVTPPTLPLDVVSSRLPPAVKGEPYSVRLVAVGGTPPYTWSLASGQTLPGGLALDSEGNIGGEALVLGAFTFRVTVSDDARSEMTVPIAIDVIDPSASVTIRTADIPRGNVGMPYLTTFEVMGGEPPYTWRIDAAPIPGIAFEADTARLVGTPTVAGEYPMIVEVRDSKGLFDRNAYVLEIVAPGNLVIVTGQSAETRLPAGELAKPYTDATGAPVRLRATRRMGGTEVRDLRWSVLLGELPPGLRLDPAQGMITGTPEEAGVFPFTIAVFDPSGDSDRATLAIVIEPPPATTPENPEDEGCGCTAARDARGEGPSSALLVVALVLAVALGRSRRRLASFAALASALGLLEVAPAHAQVIPYTVTLEARPFVPLGPGATVVPGLGDSSSSQVNLPFEIYLYGRPYRTLWINANGFASVVAIGRGHDYPPFDVPDNDGSNGFIAPLWSDWCASLDVGSARCELPAPAQDIGVLYQIDSTAGAGSITIEWRALRHFYDDTRATAASFQLKIYEGQASLIEMHYGPIAPGVDTIGTTEILSRIAIESEDGTSGMFLAPCNAIDECSTAEVLTLPDHVITLVADAGRDVAVNSVTAPATGFPGLPLSISAQIASRHRNPLGPFTLGAVLLPETATSTLGATLEYTSAPITLGPYESRRVTFDLPVSAAVPYGRYRVAVVADPAQALAEVDERNNAAFSSRLRLTERAPDFRARRLAALASQVRAGDMLQVTYTLENAGNHPGHLDARLVLSQNRTVSPTDFAIGSAIALDLDPGEVESATISVPIAAGLPTGEYYLGVVLDPTGQVSELDETNNAAVAVAVVRVVSDQLQILTEHFPPATRTVFYTAPIEIAGGAGTVTLRLVDGQLPRGMQFNAMRGEIFGIPLEVGTFTVEIEARSAMLSARKRIELEVVDPTVPLTLITQGNLPQAVVGSDYGVNIRAVGGRPPYNWRVISGRLPEGMALATDGAVVGIARRPESASFGIEVQDGMSATATVGLSIEVLPPSGLTIQVTELAEARTNEPYTQQLLALGGVRPVLWRSLTTLPMGLELGPTGVLAGNPSRVGSFRFKVEATDMAGTIDTAELHLTVTAVGPFSITTAGLPAAVPNVAYRAVIAGQGGRRPYRWQIVDGEGSLPAGVEARQGLSTLNESTDELIIAGTIDREGVWSMTVRLTDDQGRTVERPFALVSKIVEAVAPPVEEEGGCSCTALDERRGPGGFGLASLLAIGLIGLRRLRRPASMRKAQA